MWNQVSFTNTAQYIEILLIKIYLLNKYRSQDIVSLNIIHGRGVTEILDPPPFQCFKILYTNPSLPFQPVFFKFYV